MKRIDETTSGELLAEASARSGLDDFGPDDFRPGLDALLAGIARDAVVPDDRQAPLRDHLLRLLTGRQRMARDLTDHPGIAGEPIASPVFITSLPRTGSTKLHRLLGASGSFQLLPYWKGHLMARIPGQADAGRAERISETRAYERWLYEVSPDMITGHPVFAEEPEEEMQLFLYSFRTLGSGIYGSPSHVRWLAEADAAPAYDYLKAQLQYLQWQFPDERDRPWLLKTPIHFGLEPQLSRVFDTPRFIVTHRDPARVIPSIINVGMNWAKVYTDPGPAAFDVGQLVDGYVAAVSEHLAWRETLPAGAVLDLGFPEVNAGGPALHVRVFDFLGLPLTDRAAAGMRNWESANPREKHGVNSYSAERLGLDEGRLRAQFAAYVDRFGHLF